MGFLQTSYLKAFWVISCSGEDKTQLRDIV